MKIVERIKADQVTARKESDKFKATLLTTVLGEIERLPTKQPTEQEVSKVVQKMVKSIKETQDVSPSDNNLLEIDILSEYLPKLLTEEQITSIIGDNDLSTVPETMKFFKSYCVEHQCMVDMGVVRQILNG